MKASDLLVRALENEGVEYVFGVPGEENLDFVESLRTSKIQLVVTRHEQGAGFMAATVGRLTGKTGVCLSTLGPGATNFLTAAAYAQLGAFPMLMITGSYLITPLCINMVSTRRTEAYSEKQARVISDSGCGQYAEACDQTRQTGMWYCQCVFHSKQRDAFACSCSCRLCMVD